MKPDFVKLETRVPIPCGWNVAILLRGKPLTDRKIRRYEKLGYYDEGFREARRNWWQRRQARREGNFDRAADGRLIFRP